MTRKLATVEIITQINPIENADNIVLASVRGWNIIVSKDRQIGEKVIFHEIDSLCPDVEPYKTDLARLGLKKSLLDNGDIIEGFYIKTMKLRGALSQGYTVPFIAYSLEQQEYFNTLEVGDDVTEYLNINKYESIKVVSMSGDAVGNFPTNLIPKTDQERCQNISQQIYDAYLSEITFQVSYKLDGSSLTVMQNNGDKYICSRNLSLNLDKESNFTRQGFRILNRLEDTDFLKNYGFQAEMIGPGIQGNFENIKDIDYYIYNVWDIDAQEYLNPQEAESLADQLNLNYVPLYGDGGYFTLKGLLGAGLAQEDLVKRLLEVAEGDSTFNGNYREGLVFKSIDLTNKLSFKVISNRYLLKHKD